MPKSNNSVAKWTVTKSSKGTSVESYVLREVNSGRLIELKPKKSSSDIISKTVSRHASMLERLAKR